MGLSGAKWGSAGTKLGWGGVLGPWLGLRTGARVGLEAGFGAETVTKHRAVHEAGDKNKFTAATKE